mgnify:CR=1 FL=1
MKKRVAQSVEAVHTHTHMSYKMCSFVMLAIQWWNVSTR